MGDTILENLVDEILVAKCFLLLSMLADDTHDLTQAIRVIDRHFYPSERLRLIKEQIDMIAHLSLLQTFKRHNLHFFCLELLVVSRIRRLHKEHVWHVLDIFQRDLI